MTKACAKWGAWGASMRDRRRKRVMVTKRSFEPLDKKKRLFFLPQKKAIFVVRWSHFDPHFCAFPFTVWPRPSNHRQLRIGRSRRIRGLPVFLQPILSYGHLAQTTFLGYYPGYVVLGNTLPGQTCKRNNLVLLAPALGTLGFGALLVFLVLMLLALGTLGPLGTLGLGPLGTLGLGPIGPLGLGTLGLGPASWYSCPLGTLVGQWQSRGTPKSQDQTDPKKEVTERVRQRKERGESPPSLLCFQPLIFS